ncbi:hypothetical protein IEQ34_014288 [Dendrobium chrysotoxum]|uniref:BZIP domain-containing protein n=1 Tax=Dendrobium chrysotoxum TaxID=161865 RepID=A0AAV7GJU7_DENCH|nr:hypothetical protein IEQ34_014288 [Dendrobium chrysotoxum]
MTLNTAKLENASKQLNTRADFELANTKTLMEGNIHKNDPLEGEKQETTDEVLVRRIKNRERQRKYRARKRLEADMLRSYTTKQQMFWPTISASDDTFLSFKSNGSTSPLELQPDIVVSPAYGYRLYSGKKWKKEARKVYFSTTVENPSFEQQPAQVESVIKNTINPSGRRNWKAEARHKIVRVL